ncbi:unnamed protein product [Adineta steineri]|uniref:Uncharacterized protein n=1 Tax=Adineta steineri TaxID=433720 RepID=A0A814AVA8_9BILA|nr:unnamed protein product [Adineta steineri]CAF0847399.1 unnamed protein product [Adineta steineri]CAF0920380.1 unnamed protein product [Adineta steineri]
MPSQTQYENLLMLNSTTLQCPCHNISIPYKHFITINNTFHQVCSSDFVKEKWIDFLFIGGKWRNYDRVDLRSRGAAYFDLLSALCKISKITISNAIEQFLDDVFISATVVSESEFNMHMNVIINQFKTNTPARFSRDLQLLRDSTHGNAFISGYFLNWYWWINYDIDDVTVPTGVVTLKNGCSCGTQKDCITNAGIYDSNSGIQHFEIPGWNIGCSVIETLLHSTFECFYNQTCLDILNYYIRTIPPISYEKVNITAMNSTIKSRFETNTIINDIIDNLFIEQWEINVSYATFYQQCSPTCCSYSISKRNNFFYIISRILGLCGGFTAILKIVVPHSINLMLKIRNRCFRHTAISFAYSCA